MKDKITYVVSDARCDVERHLKWIPLVQPASSRCQRRLEKPKHQEAKRDGSDLLINYVQYPSLLLCAHTHTHLLTHPHSNYSLPALCSIPATVARIASVQAPHLAPSWRPEGSRERRRSQTARHKACVVKGDRLWEQSREGGTEKLLCVCGCAEKWLHRTLWKDNKPVSSLKVCLVSSTEAPE